MANPLDPQWQSYNLTLWALDLARQVSDAPATRATALQGKPFAAMVHAEVATEIDAARAELDMQAVLFLYATFESALRDHVAAQAALLAGAAGPHRAFGSDLASWFADLCDDVRMDGVTRLYTPAAGPTLAAFVGTVRKYRHWLTHGRRGTAPPAVNPQLAYARLTQFLAACRLT